MNPYHHALSSAEKYGGQAGDYLAIHQWFDESKAFLPDFRHRALRHHAEGIFLAERIFGPTLTNSAGRKIPVRFIGEQHVKEDLGRIPTAQDWLECISPQPWMLRAGQTDPKNSSFQECDPASVEHTGEHSRRFRNCYECPKCGRTWTDKWSAACDDDCPYCGARHISPVCSEDIVPELSNTSRRTLTVGELIANLQQLARQSPLGEETCVCVSRPDTDYQALRPPHLESDPDGAVVLLVPICAGCGDTPGVRMDADPGCRFSCGLPEGFVVIERCDACERFADDVAAAESVADHAHWIYCKAGHQHAIGVPRDKEGNHGPA